MTVTFDPYGPEYMANPYPIYKRMRDEAPVYHNAERNFWALSRFDDVLASLRDAKRFLSGGGVTIEGFEKGYPLLILKDAPEHSWHKGIVTKVFTPKRMAELEGFIRKRTVELLERAATKPEFDFARDFAVELPLDVISRLLDIPEEHRAEYHESVNMTLARGETRDEGEVAGAHQRVLGMLMGLVEERRSKRRDDVISMLMETEVKDEGGEMRRLEDMEVAFRFQEMGAAGHETAAKAIANGAMAFTRFPEQKKLLREKPELLANAVQEILRFEPPSQLQGRTTSEAVTLHGVTIPEGEKVMLLTGSACRDERAYPDPDRFDITRTPDPRSVFFGYGVHKCLGMHLATLEIGIAFEELFKRYPDFEVDPDQAKYLILTNVRGPASLPARLGRAA